MDVCLEVFARISRGKATIPLAAVLEYFDALEQRVDRALLAPEERDLVVEFVLESPATRALSWTEVQQLVERLLDASLETIVARAGPDDTMGPTKFNKILSSAPADRKGALLRDRIARLEILASKSRSSSLRDSLLDCYRMAVQERSSGVDRLKAGIDRQEITINRLKRKAGLKTHGWHATRWCVLALAVFLMLSFVVF